MPALAGDLISSLKNIFKLNWRKNNMCHSDMLVNFILSILLLERLFSKDAAVVMRESYLNMVKIFQTNNLSHLKSKYI